MPSAEFGKPRLISELETAYLEGDAARCYRLLEAIPFGTVLDIDKTVFELTPALPLERQLMRVSVLDKWELALIASDEETRILRGQSRDISIDEAFPELSRIFDPKDKPGVFSRTRPSQKHHPLPDWGDVTYWQAIADNCPNVENRIVFQGNDDIKAFKFLHFYGQLFADE